MSDVNIKGHSHEQNGALVLAGAGNNAFIKWTTSLGTSDFVIISEFTAFKKAGTALSFVFWIANTDKWMWIGLDGSARNGMRLYYGGGSWGKGGNPSQRTSPLQANKLHTIMFKRTRGRLTVFLDGVQLPFDLFLREAIWAVGWVPFRNTIAVKQLYQLVDENA